MRALILALLCSPAWAGYACLEVGDPAGRRWFQDEPCAPGYVHSPLPPAPLIREAPRIPEGWGMDPIQVGSRPRGIVIWTRDSTGRTSVSIIRRRR